ncbi:MAG: major capsid protein [Methylobacter sp.]
MPQMNLGDARVVDPILTTHSRGYRTPGIVRVGNILFPRAPISKRGAKIILFGKEAFRQYNSIRAQSSATKRIQVGYTSDTVSLVQHALEGVVSRELLDESAGIPSANLGMRAVNVPLDSIGREIEIEQATIAQNPANYDVNHKLALSGTDRWDDYANSDPGKDMDAAHQAIRATTGRRGNVLTLGPLVKDKLHRHPKIIGHFYTGAQAGAQSVTDEQLSTYFKVKKIAVGDEVYLPETASDTDDFTDVWGKTAILAYVPDVEGDGDIEVPSYGYTYFLQGYPMVEVPYYEKNIKSWAYPVTDEVRPVQTGMGAGFLFTSVIQ